jgi:hypothetical protein
VAQALKSTAPIIPAIKAWLNVLILTSHAYPPDTHCQVDRHPATGNLIKTPARHIQPAGLNVYSASLRTGYLIPRDLASGLDKAIESLNADFAVAHPYKLLWDYG